MPHPKGYIKRQAKRLTDGEINRRRFVMSALSAGVTMPTALSLASRAEALTPKQGGTLRIALAEGADPAQPETPFGRLAAFARGNTLTEVAPDGKLVGELAQEFGTPDGGATWVFNLQSGITFHDGRFLTSTDVLATLAERLRGAEMRATDPHQVVVTLQDPDPAFARKLADPRFVIRPGGDQRLGTGPYVFDEEDAQGTLRLTRNPNYWKPGRAHFDRVELSALPEMSTRQQAILAGDVDYIDGIDPRALALLQRAPNVSVLEVPCGRHIAITAETTPAVLTTLQNRLPYQELLDRILLGHGTAGGADAPALPPSVSGPLRLAVFDDGVPRTMEAAHLIAERLNESDVPVELVPASAPSPAAKAHARIAWQRRAPKLEGQAPNTLVALWANDISAHKSALAHESDLATNYENDGARLIERWWFA